MKGAMPMDIMQESNQEFTVEEVLFRHQARLRAAELVEEQELFESEGKQAPARPAYAKGMITYTKMTISGGPLTGTTLSPSGPPISYSFHTDPIIYEEDMGTITTSVKGEPRYVDVIRTASRDASVAWSDIPEPDKSMLIAEKKIIDTSPKLDDRQKNLLTQMMESEYFQSKVILDKPKPRDKIKKKLATLSKK